jgi:hypothetical protein
MIFLAGKKFCRKLGLSFILKRFLFRSYTAMQDVVDEMFPPYKGSIILAAADEFSEFTFWRTQPPLVEDTPSEPTPPAPVAKATA